MCHLAAPARRTHTAAQVRSRGRLVPAPFAFLGGNQHKDKAPADVLDRLDEVPVYYVSDGKTAITVRSEVRTPLPMLKRAAC